MLCNMYSANADIIHIFVVRINVQCQHFMATGLLPHTIII